MTISDDDIIRDTNERNSLQRAIADLETAIAVSNPGTRRILESSLDGVKARVSTLNKKISDAVHEREVETQRQAVAVAALAQKEAGLNESEKQTYSGFLAKEFFTKKDFGKLEEFYVHSYGRLSEGGKEEMSHRFWEGIRHNEYRFEDAPAAVREKEEKLAYKKLSAPTRDSEITNIPASDREEFLEAYRSGDHKATSHILSRESFRQNMSLKTSVGANHRAATVGRAGDDAAILADKPSGISAGVTESSAMTNLKLSAETLEGVTLSETDAIPSAAALPNAVAPSVNGRSPV